jgi:hypothetical protein
VPFRFESLGSQIIFYDREEDFSAVEAAREGRPIRDFRELDPSELLAKPSGLLAKKNELLAQKSVPIPAPMRARTDKPDGKPVEVR